MTNDTNQAPRLLDQVRHALRSRHYSLRTEEAYVPWIRRYILFHQKRHPQQMGAAEVVAFLNHLAVERHVSASTQNQALAALLFLTASLFGALRGVHWLMAMLLYGSGLRLGECLRLRVKDVEFERGEILVREGKGDRDRITMLPGPAREPLTNHLRQVRSMYDADVRRGLRVALPAALARKYPNASAEMGLVLGLPGRACLHGLAMASPNAFACMIRYCRRPSTPPPDASAWRSRLARTLSATASPRICWRPATTSAPCRSSSAIAMCKRR